MTSIGQPNMWPVNISDPTITVTLKISMTQQSYRQYAADFDTAYWDGSPITQDTLDHISSWVASDLNRSTLADYAQVEIGRAHITWRD